MAAPDEGRASARPPALTARSTELLEAFLRSPLTPGIEYIAPADLREVTRRFFTACESLGLDPGDLRPDGLRTVLERALPPLYPRADPLGQRTIDVLRTYLAFLAPERPPGSPPDRARALGETLEACAEPFRARVREG